MFIPRILGVLALSSLGSCLSAQDWALAGQGFQQSFQQAGYGSSAYGGSPYGGASYGGSYSGGYAANGYGTQGSTSYSTSSYGSSMASYGSGSEDSWAEDDDLYADSYDAYSHSGGAALASTSGSGDESVCPTCGGSGKPNEGHQALGLSYCLPCTGFGVVGGSGRPGSSPGTQVGR